MALPPLNHLPGLYDTGTKDIFSGDSYSALQNQLTQTNTFGPFNNIACMQNLQGTEGDEEVLRRIRYVYGFPERYNPSSGRAPFPGERNVSPVSMAVPVTMGTVSTTSHGTPFEEDYFYSNLQAESALTLSNGLVSPLQTFASSVYANQTASSSLVYPPSYNNAWATHPDTSAVGPEAQTVAPRMNTVTPCVVCCNDRGGASVGAAAYAMTPAPGPTPGMNDNVHDMHPLSTASTSPPRDAEKRSHRNRQKTQAPRAMGHNRTRRTSTPRGVPLGLAQTTVKAPPVPYDADINTVAARLLNEGARPATVEVLRTQVFNNGINETALKAKFIHMEQFTNHSRVKRKYLLLLEQNSKGYWCLLCPQDCPMGYKNAQDSLRHLRRDHFGLALTCRCGW